MPVSQLDCWTVNEMEETTKCLLYIYITDQAWRPCKEMCYGPGSNFKLELLQSGWAQTTSYQSCNRNMNWTDYHPLPAISTHKWEEDSANESSNAVSGWHNIQAMSFLGAESGLVWYETGLESAVTSRCSGSQFLAFSYLIWTVFPSFSSLDYRTTSSKLWLGGEHEVRARSLLCKLMHTELERQKKKAFEELDYRTRCGYTTFIRISKWPSVSVTSSKCVLSWPLSWPILTSGYPGQNRWCSHGATQRQTDIKEITMRY